MFGLFIIIPLIFILSFIMYIVINEPWGLLLHPLFNQQPLLLIPFVLVLYGFINILIDNLNIPSLNIPSLMISPFKKIINISKRFINFIRGKNNDNILLKKVIKNHDKKSKQLNGSNNTNSSDDVVGSDYADVICPEGFVKSRGDNGKFKCVRRNIWWKLVKLGFILLVLLFYIPVFL